MSFRSFIILSALVVVALAADKSECETKHDATWAELRKDLKNPSEKALCLEKCGFEKRGALDSEGNINQEKMRKIVDDTETTSEKEKAEVMECIKKLAPVKTCADVRPIHECIHKSKVNE